MAGQPAHAQRLSAVEAGFRSLPGRYLGAAPGFDATYHIRLCDLGHTWEVRCTTHGARVCRGATKREPDVTISTDAETWLALRRGEFSGVEAFGRRRLAVRGNLDYAVGFEGMFRVAGNRPPLVQVYDVPVGRHRISTLTMGSGPDVLLLHGLGGTRASLFEAAVALSRQYRVHAPDLPGFGSSSKSARGAYNAAWFAEIMLGLMNGLGISRAHLVGNSMGGRIAIEVGLTQPERVYSLALLCPAVAWLKRGLHPIVRLIRPELGLLPHGFSRRTVAAQMWNMFHHRDAIDPAVGDLMVDEFRRIYGSAAARYAFLASARNIYLEAPFGPRGFYPRLSRLQPPSLFVWGSHDSLVPAAFGRHVRKWLPRAQQLTIDECGHVPQVEYPAETSQLLMDFFDRVAGARPALALPAGQTAPAATAPGGTAPADATGAGAAHGDAEAGDAAAA